MIDLICSYILFSSLMLAFASYFVRCVLVGRPSSKRLEGVERTFLGHTIMEAAYWWFEPMVGFLRWLHVSPNMVTGASLLPMLGAAVAVALGHFGIAAVLAIAGSFCDLLDGVLARRQGTSSAAGEVFDAAVDRYAEFFVLAGIIVFSRNRLPMMLLALAALLGSFMVSYGTAKAEAMDVEPPKGAMRRATRSVYILCGMSFVPCWYAWSGVTWPSFLREAPLTLSLAIVAVVTNVSSIRRFYLTAQRTREPRSAPALPPSTANQPVLVR